MCLCPHCKFEGVLVPESEPLGVSLLCLLMLYVSSATWVSAGKRTANLSWGDDSCSPQPLCHGWTTSWASQWQAQARCCAWGWQLWGVVPGGAAPPVGVLPWAAWVGGCSGQKSGLNSRLPSSCKDGVYWAVPWNLWRKTNHPMKQSKRHRLPKYGLEPSGKKCFLRRHGLEMLLWALLCQCIRT